MREWKSNPECETMAQRRNVLRLLMGPRFVFWRNGNVLKLDCADTVQLCEYIKQTLTCTLKMGEFYGMQIISIKLLKKKKARKKIFTKNNNPETMERVSVNQLWKETMAISYQQHLLQNTSRHTFKGEGMGYFLFFPPNGACCTEWIKNISLKWSFPF